MQRQVAVGGSDLCCIGGGQEVELCRPYATNHVAGTLRTYIVSTKPVRGPVNELVLRCRPEVNTIGRYIISPSNTRLFDAADVYVCCFEIERIQHISL